MTNEQRASYGRDAIAAGTPDAGKNDDRVTDAGDAIANILHAVACDSSHAETIVARAVNYFEFEVRA